jgi:hypothetical protein
VGHAKRIGGAGAKVLSRDNRPGSRPFPQRRSAAIWLGWARAVPADRLGCKRHRTRAAKDCRGTAWGIAWQRAVWQSAAVGRHDSEVDVNGSVLRCR